MTAPRIETIRIRAPGASIEGDLAVPDGPPRGLVVFAHGSGSSRHSRRNQAVAEVLQRGGFATLLLDLLTADEAAAEADADAPIGACRFDVGRLAGRVIAAVDWAATHPHFRQLGVIAFGASTGAAAALVSAAERPGRVRAVVSRGGRPDLAGDALTRVRAPSLFIVGGDDALVIELNRTAMARMRATAWFEIVPGATHLFEEPGALERVAELALAWSRRYAFVAAAGASG
jgi:dienelactone hydrolase